jgi:Zn-dependent protease
MPTELPQRENEPRLNESGKSSPSRQEGGGEHAPRLAPQQPPAGQPPAQDGSAITLGSVAGIPIRLHITFFLLLAWMGFLGTGTHQRWAGVIFAVALSACVVLHELAHALVAKRYGLRTRSITLYPIGGIASMETPPNPRQELWIALAGPATNLVIAGIIALALHLGHHPIGGFQPGLLGPNMAINILWANVVLAAFNMLPAFPMDGGRVLRALLARVTDEVSATTLAARIGQGLAFLLGLFGLLGGNFLLIIIAAFVYMGAGQEAAMFQTHALMAGHRVREAMLREFHTLPVNSTLQQAADALLAGSQQDFPIVNGEEVVGILPRAALMRGIASMEPDSYVAGIMERNFPQVRPEDDLETVLTQMQQPSPILVMESDANGHAKLVGMITQENLLEFLTLTRLQQRPR